MSLMVRPWVALWAGALLLVGCGGSQDSVAGGPAASSGTVNVGPEGGALRSGDLQVDFPADSVSGPLTVSDQTVTLSTIPRHLRPVSAVHKLELSHPQYYRARTAQVSFSLPTASETVSVYHSDDGVNWTTLGSGASAKTHKFSYFFAGEIAATMYTVNVQNDSQNFGTAFIYRATNNPQVVSLAMMARFLAPRQRCTFQWTEGYDFFVSNGGALFPGVVVNPTQVTAAAMPSNNFVSLTNSGFTPTSAGPSNGYAINPLADVPVGQFSAGLQISGYPALAAPVLPFLLSLFQPTEAPYYLVFGDYMESGTVLAPGVPNMIQVQLPGGNTPVTATFTQTQAWTLSSL